MAGIFYRLMLLLGLVALMISTALAAPLSVQRAPGFTLRRALLQQSTPDDTASVDTGVDAGGCDSSTGGSGICATPAAVNSGPGSNTTSSSANGGVNSAQIQPGGDVGAGSGGADDNTGSSGSPIDTEQSQTSGN